MDTIEYRQTTWAIKFREAAALTRAQYANYRVVIEGAKTNDAMATIVRHEDFPGRRHHGDTDGILQRAGGSHQMPMPHPPAIQSPQHRHQTVAVIRHEEETFVGGKHQALRCIELAGLVVRFVVIWRLGTL